MMKLSSIVLGSLIGIGSMIQGVCSLSSPYMMSMIKPMQKQHVLFFPARFQQPVPREMYGNFISKLSNNYEVHIASSNPEDNSELLKKLTLKTDYDNEVALISHSSGVADLWNTYSSLTSEDVDKIILIEPLDLQKGVGSESGVKLLDFGFNFNMNIDTEMLQLNKLNDKIEEIVETDYLELLKSNIFGGFGNKKKTKKAAEDGGEDEDAVRREEEGPDGGATVTRERGKMFVVKHKLSDKWRFIPTIPPLSLLNANLMNFQDSMVIDEIMIDKFSHFDILDRPWANLMNRASLRNNKEQEELDEYLELLDDIVFRLMS